VLLLGIVGSLKVSPGSRDCCRPRANSTGRLPGRGAHDARRFDSPSAADDASSSTVGRDDCDIELAERSQRREQPHTGGGAAMPPPSSKPASGNRSSAPPIADRPEHEDAAIWLETVATATPRDAEEDQQRVIRNPPPIPNMPE